MAYAAIPQDYWQLSCWSCRETGHSTFTCPKLTVAQRLYFAYKYYLYQCEANPVLKQWYQQKAQALQGTAADPGPRPGRGDGGGQRGGFSGGRGRGGMYRGNGSARNNGAQASAVHILTRDDKTTDPSDSTSTESGNE